MFNSMSKKITKFQLFWLSAKFPQFFFQYFALEKIICSCSVKHSSEISCTKLSTKTQIANSKVLKPSSVEPMKQSLWGSSSRSHHLQLLTSLPSWDSRSHPRQPAKSARCAPSSAAGGLFHTVQGGRVQSPVQCVVCIVCIVCIVCVVCIVCIVCSVCSVFSV